MALYILLIASICIIIFSYNLFFYSHKKHRSLLAYEESRRYLPFVVTELYGKDYQRIRRTKLLGLLLSTFMALFLAVLYLVLWGDFLQNNKFFPPIPGHLLPLNNNLMLYRILLLLPFVVVLILSLRWRFMLLRYYNTSFFHLESGFGEDELIANDSDARGLRGEYYAWRLFSFIPEPRHILISPLVPKPGGSFAEIDLVVLSKKGIFCVEAKNRHGTFLPAEGSNILEDDWLQVQAPQDQKARRVQTVKNPLRQNLHHIWTLSNFWHVDAKYFFNVLCFGRKARLRKSELNPVTELNPEGSVFEFGQREKLLRLYNDLPNILGDDTIDRLADELNAVCKMSRVRRESLLHARSREMDRNRKRGRKNHKLRAGNEHFRSKKRKKR